MRRILGMALAVAAMLILLAAPAWADGVEGFGGGDTGYPPTGGGTPVAEVDDSVAVTGSRVDSIKWVIAAGALMSVGTVLVVADRRKRRLAIQ